MDVFQSSSPVSDDVPQEEVMEEEEVSTINVRIAFCFGCFFFESVALSLYCCVWRLTSPVPIT